MAEQIQAVSYHPKVKVYTGATIVQTTGQPGQCDVTIEAGGNTVVHRVGAVVSATGWKPYDPAKLSHLGYGLHADVVTNVEFEKWPPRARSRDPPMESP